MSGQVEVEKGKEKRSKKKSKTKKEGDHRKSSKKSKRKSSDKGDIEVRRSSSSEKRTIQRPTDSKPIASKGEHESHDAVIDDLHQQRITEHETPRTKSSEAQAREEGGSVAIEHNLDLMESLSNIETEEGLKSASRPDHAEHEIEMLKDRARKKRQEAIERRERRLSNLHQPVEILPGAVAMEGGNQLGKAGGGIALSETTRPGAVSMTGGQQKGKRSGPSYAATTGTVHAIKPGAVATVGGSPNGKYRLAPASHSESLDEIPGADSLRGDSQLENQGANSARPGAVAMIGGRKNGKRGPEITESSEAYDAMKTPGAVSMSGPAQKGKARFSSGASVGQVGAVAMSRPASRDKENSTVVNDFFLRQGQRSPSQASFISSISYDTKSLSSNVGAMSVASAAPRGKGDGPSIVSSAESYDDASQLGAVSVAGVPRGKRTDESVGSRDDSTRPGAQSVASVRTRGKRGRHSSAQDRAGTHYGEGSTMKGDETQSASVSTSSSKERVSHFPASDLYASLSSLPDMSSVENKGRISEFPSEDFYEEDIDEQELASMKKAALQGPAYTSSGDDYEVGNVRHDTRSRDGSLAHSRDRSTRSGTSTGSHRSQVTEQQSNRRRSTGAFFINGEQVETRGRGSITTVTPGDSNSNLDLLDAEVAPSTEFYRGNEVSIGTNQSDTNISEAASSTLKHGSCHCSKMSYICLAVVAAVAGVVVAVLVVVVFKGDKNNGPESPAGSPTFGIDPQRESAIRVILLPVTDEATLADPSSPQFAAEQWVVGQDLISQITAGAISISEEAVIITRYTLAVLFFSTGGETSWLSSVGWMEGNTDECKWEFLTCVGGEVSSINFGESGNNLLGSIPSEMKMLTALQELSFGRNSISQVHPDVGLLTKLQVFDFNTNKITGPFPEFILNITTLQILRMERNELTGAIPSSIGFMTNLVYLILGQNKFTGTISNQLSGLQSLAGLDLSSNQQLKGNALDFIDGLNQLAFLLLDGNSFTGQLDAQRLLNFPSLEILSMASNQLIGSIPSEIGSLSSLGEVYLDGNKLTGTIPATMANAPIKTVTLDLNQLTGSVPPEFCSSTSLKSILVDCNIGCSCSTCTQNC